MQGLPQARAEELAYRRAVRDIDRMLVWETGRVKRKQANNFARFLRHPNDRIRQYADGVAAGQARPTAAVEDGDLSWEGNRCPTHTRTGSRR